MVTPAGKELLHVFDFTDLTNNDNLIMNKRITLTPEIISKLERMDNSLLIDVVKNYQRYNYDISILNNRIIKIFVSSFSETTIPEASIRNSLD